MELESEEYGRFAFSSHSDFDSVDYDLAKTRLSGLKAG